VSAPAVVGIAGAALALALPVLGAATALEVSARVAGAADAAALAAADAALGWIHEDPCALAATVAASAQAALASCDVDLALGEARVVVAASTILGEVSARARAAPTETG